MDDILGGRNPAEFNTRCLKSMKYKHEPKRKKYPDATFQAATREMAYMPMRYLHEGGIAKVYKLERQLEKDAAEKAAKPVDTEKELVKQAREAAREKRLKASKKCKNVGTMRGTVQSLTGEAAFAKKQEENKEQLRCQLSE